MLSKDEILSITDHVLNLKHKTILLTTYSSGLRISETLYNKNQKLSLSKNLR
ncbi:hypothetical protein DSOL_3177 [Desulfosporosinus metallidurans]|uniref:Phage integrase family protein n=1 Tax=Desulfosporosinus metallidurans TaxID=1888891 RepID=A0A1Q8QSB3_9FIRM|nr:hypothetical protein DSOL_3177 [Desulfosporosinus metallidurans]